MYCRFCGAFVGLGNPHECPKEPVRKLSYLSPQQLRSWTIAGYGMIAAVLVTWAMSAAQMIDLSRVHSTLAQINGPTDGDQVGSLLSLLQQSDSLGLWVSAIGVTYIVGYVFWFRAARKMVIPLRDEGKQALAHWTYLVWRISILAWAALSLSLRVGRDKPTTIAEAVADIEARVQNAMILDVVRCLTGLLLIVALVVAMRKVRMLARPAEQTVAGPA
jgi:hypothetical protein